MANVRTCVRWTRNEHLQLAYWMQKAFNRGETISDAARYASKKLDRTWQACVYQYNEVLRSKGVLEAYAQEHKLKTHSVTITDAVESMVKHTPRISKITIHGEGATSNVAEILVDTDQILVAKAANLVITIEK